MRRAVLRLVLYFGAGLLALVLVLESVQQGLVLPFLVGLLAYCWCIGSVTLIGLEWARHRR